MRLLSMSVAVMVAVGCATASPPPISDQQRQRFQATVATARRTATSWDCPRGDEQLRAAESDFLYAENSPRDPARAARMAAQAQKEAEAAIELCRGGPGSVAVAKGR